VSPPPSGESLSPRSLTVLGCDGSYPGPGGAASGYLVRAGETAVLLDLGPGTFANLQKLADPADVDAVVLSHEHPDHWTDLESLAVWLRHGHRGRPAGDKKPLPVLAPPGLRRRSYFSDDPMLAWHEVAPSDCQVIGGLMLRFVATDHGPPTLAVRIDPDRGGDPPDPARALAYSSDSGADWTVEELGTGLGTVLCEATYTRELEGTMRHLSGRQAGAMAAAAGAERLVVTHRWPTVSADELGAEATEAFGRPVDQAAIGRVFEW
jgi:ribonuclease BN (tRNA processing enzyme)